MKGNGSSASKFRRVPTKAPAHSSRASPNDIDVIFEDETPKDYLPTYSTMLPHLSSGVTRYLNKEDTKALSQSHPSIGKAINAAIIANYNLFKPKFVKLLNEFGTILNEIYNIQLQQIKIKIENTKISINYIHGINVHSSHISIATVNPFHYKYKDDINDNINIDALKLYLIKDISKLKNLKIDEFIIRYEQFNIVFSNGNKSLTYFKNNNGLKLFRSYKELKEYAIKEDSKVLTPIFELFDQLTNVLNEMNHLLETYGEKLQYFQKIINSPPPATQGGKMTLRKSAEKVKIGNKERIVYLGAHNKKYIKMNKQIVALKDVNRST